MSAGLLLVPDLGAEEGAGWPRGLGLTPVSALAEAWRWLFASHARFELPADAPRPGPREVWPGALGDPPAEAALPWLPERGRVAWMPVPGLAGALPAGPPLHDWGAEAGVLWRLHDKAWALAAARDAGWEPPPLRGLSRAFEPAELRDAHATVAAVDAALTAWPPWTRARFTLKPRWGTSGRGRVAGEGTADTEALRRALPRLAERGGAVLEPWLDRGEDLSVQLCADDAGVTLLGSLRQWTTAPGQVRGLFGSVDSRGRVFADGPHDEPAREAAAGLVARARGEGLRGPCGVDALAFRAPGPDGPRTWLRPVVELNARFTAGTVAVGLVRRALPRVRAALGLEPGARRGFLFAWTPPPGGWEAARRRVGDDALLLSLSDGGDGSGLLFAREPARVEAALAAG